MHDSFFPVSPNQGSHKHQENLRELHTAPSELLREVCIYELFAIQAARTPQSIAVIHGNEALNYGELDRRTNQLARYLQALGVKPETPVGICTERSLDMVVGLLGILKAGGAYVPLDPAARATLIYDP
jgi:non-ribosomal peptide synthetase component F